jgi:hypothetical protein
MDNRMSIEGLRDDSPSTRTAGESSGDWPGEVDRTTSPVAEDGQRATRDGQRVGSATDLARRVVTRMWRRPQAWIDRPWTTERIVQAVTAIVLVGASTFAVVQVIHPGLVIDNNTPTGGDFGAHVMAPAYLRDHLLPNFQLSGWTNYWYGGTPLYRYYMVVPALIVLFFDMFLPYGIAMKITAVLGLLTLPFCCWCFGRLAKFRFPMPELFALGGMIFLFDESFSIYGGNVKSTMAGEFSFSIALSFAVLGLGLFAHALETGRHRNWTIIVLAMAVLSHGIVLLFVALGMLLMWLVWLDRQRVVFGAVIGIGVLLVSAFWVFPFLFNHEFMTDMKYGYRPNAANDSFWYMFFPWPSVFDFIVSALALVGFVASVVRRHLNGAWMGVMCVALMAAVFATRESLPVIGLLWNPRLLPFLYLVRLLLMMVGIVEIVSIVVRGVYGVRGVLPRVDLISGAVTAGVVLLVVMVIELFVFQNMPGGGFTTKNDKTVYAWPAEGVNLVTLSPKKKDAEADGWTRYNFMGYEGREWYAEYKLVIDKMAGVGADPRYGCGRAIWENNDDPGLYGTTMSLMLLPHWTDGCITSMEGLFFEASGTTPYHFVTSAAVSGNSADGSAPSQPVRQLRYDLTDVDRGVPYMQSLGINYLMVFTESAKREADSRPDALTLIEQAGPWNVYAVAGSDLVEPLTVQPVVVNERDSDARPGDQRERNLELGMSWFQNRSEWAAIPADDGPDEWQRIDVEVDLARRVGEVDDENRRVDTVIPADPIQPVTLPEVNVLDWNLENQALQFTVDQVGVPVVVKLSYFPNWKVEGADGPYRIAPNMMVVVPRETTVRMSYERSGLDVFAYLVTFGGIALMVLLRRRGDVRFDAPVPGHAMPPQSFDTWADDFDRDLWSQPAADDTGVLTVGADPLGDTFGDTGDDDIEPVGADEDHAGTRDGLDPEPPR